MVNQLNLLRSKIFLSVISLLVQCSVSYAQNIPYEQDYFCNQGSSSENWVYKGPFHDNAYDDRPYLGIVNSVAVDPTNHNILFAGSNTAGLYKSINGGSTWKSVTDELLISGLGVESIAISPEDTNIIYAVTGSSSNGYGNWSLGVIKSIDGGETWFTTVDSQSESIHPNFKFSNKKGLDIIMIDPLNSERIIVGGNRALLVSNDGGLNWESKPILNQEGIDVFQIYDTNNKDLVVEDIEFDPYNPGHIYASTSATSLLNESDLSMSYLFKSTDYGESWMVVENLNINFGQHIKMDFCPFTEKLFLCYSTTEGMCEISYTTDGALSFTTVFNGYIDVSFYCLEYEASNQTENLFFVAGVEFFIVYYDGENWTVKEESENLHVDNRDLLMVDGVDSQDVLLLGHDGGISKVEWNGIVEENNQNLHWENLNGEGLLLSQIYGAGGWSGKNVKLFGAQDLGTWKIEDPNLERLFGADGAEIGISEFYRGRAVGGTQNVLQNIMNYGNYDAPLSGPWISGPKMLKQQREFGFKNNNHFYAAQKTLIKGYYDEPFISFNLGVLDQPYMDGVSSENNKYISAFSVAPSNEDIVYVAFEAPFWSNDIYSTNPESVNQSGEIISKLFKSIDGGYSYTDITNSFFVQSESNNLYKWDQISCILIDPNDENHLYVGMKEYHPFQNEIKNRVLESFDAGLTWVDKSVGLPRFPIHQLLYHIGSDEIIYAATESGVYKWDKESGLWECFNNGLPPSIVTSMYIDYCTNSLNISTYGKGMWELNLDPQIDVYHIYGNKEISTFEQRFFQTDIIIHNGAKLNIKGRVSMNKNCKIIVEKGGELLVDGGIVSNYCEDRWDGIEVWGDFSLSQSPMSNQGIVEFKNGAIIENANCGIRVGRLIDSDEWEIDWSKAGGIVIADNSTFRNNIKDVGFTPYHNSTYLGELANNKSRFRNCDFIVDENFNFDPVDIAPNNFISRVSLYKVEGISFTECSFYIEDELIESMPSLNRGAAIKSIESGFSLTGNCEDFSNNNIACVPSDLTCQNIGETTNINHSLIQGFQTGIDATAYNGGMPIKISKTLFDKNIVSSRFTGSNNVSFKENKVRLSQENSFYESIINLPDQQLGEAVAVGAQFIGCTEYTISRNVFEGEDSLPDYSQSKKVGLNIIYSGHDANEVYLNDFSGLYAGAVIQRQNRNQYNWDFTNEGLQLRCNEFENTHYDIALTDKGSMAALQGSWAENSQDFTAPAGNVFTEEHLSSEGDIFVCDNCSWLVYLHHSEGSNQEKVVPVEFDYQDVYPVNQDVIYVDRQSVCPINQYENIETPILKTKINEKRNLIAELESSLEHNIDLGNSEVVVEFINNLSNSDIDIRNLLLEISPYVSDEALTALINRESPISQWVLCEILIENSPLSIDVINEYENYTLSNYLNNILLSYQTGLSSKSKDKADIEKEISLEESMVREYVQRISSENNPEEEVVCSRIKDAYTTAETNSRVKSQFPILVKEGNFIDAEGLLSEYTEVCSDDNYVDYAELVLELSVNNEVDNTQLESLISNGCYESISALVMSDLYTEISVDFPSLVLPSESNKRNYTTPKPVEREKLLIVSPNPASNYFYVSFSVPELLNEGVKVVIRDNIGRVVDQKDFDISSGYSFFESYSYAKGTYNVSLEVNSEVLESNKLIIK